MRYSLFALLAILVIFPAAFLAIYFHRRAVRKSRILDRQRFNDLVEFDRVRRAQQWAALPADGIPGIVLLNAVDPSADPLRRAPPALFVEVAPGIWRSTNGTQNAGSISNEADNTGGGGPHQWEQSMEAHRVVVARTEHSPYGDDVAHNRVDEDGSGDRNEEPPHEDRSGVTGLPVVMDDAPDTMPTVVEYGTAAYLPRSPSLKERRQFSAYTACVENDSAVESSRPGRCPSEPFVENGKIFRE
ncbi:hypothetical protein NQL31_000201 [Lotmaria passim]